jgi:hypothetical protein
LITSDRLKDLIFFAVMFGISIVVAWIAKGIYDQAVQAPICFDYARHMELPNVDVLEFADVKVRDRYDRGHNCTFRNTRTGAIVILDFEPQDIPTTADSFQGVILAISFVGTMFGGTWIAGNLMIRLGILPDRLFASFRPGKSTPQ